MKNLNLIKSTLAVGAMALAAGLFLSAPGSTSGNDSPRPFTVVDLGAQTPPPLQIAVQACAGMANRESGGSAYTLMKDQDSKWLEELGLQPEQTMKPEPFLQTCLARFPRSVLYSYEKQRTLLPNILTVGAVLDAVPVDETMEVPRGDVVFDAITEFKELDTPYLATRYVYENYVNDTTGLAMLNPGYDYRDPKVWDPKITREADARMIDFVFSDRLFTMYLNNGCIKGTRQHSLLNQIVTANPWTQPIGVYGYGSYWLVFGGFLFESQTECSDARNMGAIPTTVNNLSFFSTRHEPITEPGELKQNEPEKLEYDPAKTYVAFIVGDGDNIAFIMAARARWLRQRVAACRQEGATCPPLTWSISPHLTRIAPDVLEWYYDMSHETGKDYFMLPPSGHLYSYPGALEESTMQDRYVAATEHDARLLGTSSTVHWEWFDNWRYAEREFLPRYAKKDGAIKGVFPVNVPYLFPTFTWEHHQFFKVLTGADGGQVVVFRPRPWRGINDRGERADPKYYLNPQHMAQELGKYPPGTVTAVYMTSDGGLTLENSFQELIKILPDHVVLVSTDTAARLALEASERADKN